MTSRALDEIWEEKDGLVGYPWRAQMKNYVAFFTTRENAEKYVARLKELNEVKK